MSIDDQKFMAAEGLVQWLVACVELGQRLTDIYTNQIPTSHELNSSERRILVAKTHTEGSFLANAANQVTRYRAWARYLGLFPNVDFAELDAFDQKVIRDLRNMREHVIDYFCDKGNNQDRWLTETPEYSADASSVVGSMIGGRLDYKAFTSACKVVLQRVLAAN
jgi:hypothetical protein